MHKHCNPNGFLSIFFKGFLVISLLSGCQHFPSLFQEQTETLQTPQVSDQNVTTHEFHRYGEQTLIGDLAALVSEKEDSLPDIARHYGLGFNDVSIANPTLSPWTPKPGSKVLLPLRFILPDTAHQDIVLNLANMRMFYYPKNQPDKVYTYPVGIGREGWSTPMGLTKIISKTVNPAWTVPASIHQEHAQKGDKLPNVVVSGPNNPLGKFAMRLAIPGYLIHGTNKPYGIGLQVSHGCIQLYPEDIETLFDKIRVGTAVNIVHQPYLTAWQDSVLYLEANEPLQKWEKNKSQLKKQLFKNLKKISQTHQVDIDWERVETIIQQANGIPTPILRNSPGFAELVDNALLLSHPIRLFQQPVIEELRHTDWALLVASFDNENEAQELTVMLNHQGPIIPARKVQKDQNYYVIAGPFKNKAEMLSVAKRIKLDFELKATPLKPQMVSEAQNPDSQRKQQLN